MFQNYVSAKSEKRRGWMFIFVVISVAAHVVGISALLIHSFWVLTPLDPPDAEVALAAPPPPPPPPPPAADPPDEIPDEVVTEVEDTVQPDPEREEPEDAVTEDEIEGIEGGIEGGVSGGDLGGVAGGVAGGGDPPPEAPPSEPEVVPPEQLNRVAGNEEIMPSTRTQDRINRDGRDLITAQVKMCLDPSGGVESVNIQQSSGYSDYDNRLLSEMRQWRYDLDDAQPVCTTITFNYRQQ